MIIAFLYGLLVGFVGGNLFNYIIEVIDKRDKR